MKIKSITNPAFMPGFRILRRSEIATNQTQWIDSTGSGGGWTVMSEDHPDNVGKRISEVAHKEVLCREPV